MDKKATFRHVWQESEAQPVFDTYLWHDEKKNDSSIWTTG
jgi:hypothetical protein